jgi:hypothetical protein
MFTEHIRIPCRKFTIYQRIPNLDERDDLLSCASLFLSGASVCRLIREFNDDPHIAGLVRSPDLREQVEPENAT